MSESDDDPFAEEPVYRSRRSRRSNRHHDSTSSPPRSPRSPRSPRLQAERDKKAHAAMVAAELQGGGRKSRSPMLSKKSMSNTEQKALEKQQQRPLSTESTLLREFLEQAGLEDALEEFEELHITWTELKVSEEQHLRGAGIPEQYLEHVLNALGARSDTALGRAKASGQSKELRDFLDGCDIEEAMPLFEERDMYWPFLETCSEADLENVGLPRKVVARVVQELRKLPETAIGEQARVLPPKKKRVVNLDQLGADVDFEAMDDLPPLPDEMPPISNAQAYKRYMRLKYEYQRREAEARSPKPSPREHKGPPPPVPRRSDRKSPVTSPRPKKLQPRRAAPPPPAGVPPLRDSGVMLVKKGGDEDDPLDALMTNVIMLKEQQARGSKAEFNDFIDDDSFLGDRPPEEDSAFGEESAHSTIADSPPQQLSITDSYLDKLSEVLAEELNLEEELETELAELTRPPASPPVSLANVLYDSEESSSVEPIADPMETAGVADFVDETDVSSYTEVESASEIYSEITKVDDVESASEIYSEITRAEASDDDDDNVEDLSYLAPQPGHADEMESDLPLLPPIESGIESDDESV